MSPKYKDKDGEVLLSFSGKWISWAHTAAAYSKSLLGGFLACILLTVPLAAFISALIVGVSLHYHKIVQNEYYGYPQVCRQLPHVSFHNRTLADSSL